MSGEHLVSWIAGLMRENYEAVGFIPDTKLRDHYLAHERYVLQTDESGRRVGYLLHGVPQPGHSLTVAQHCIQVDRRSHGYGEAALAELIERADRVGCPSIRVRCATDLDSLEFWLGQGFRLLEVVPGGVRRQRQIARLWLPRALPMFPEDQP